MNFFTMSHLNDRFILCIITKKLNHLFFSLGKNTMFLCMRCWHSNGYNTWFKNMKRVILKNWKKMFRGERHIQSAPTLRRSRENLCLPCRHKPTMTSSVLLAKLYYFSVCHCKQVFMIN